MNAPRVMETAPVDYLTVEEAAELARCDHKTIRRAIHSERLRAFRPANRLLIREPDVRAWIESRTASSSARTRPPRMRRGRPPAPGSVAALRALDSELA